MRTHTILGVCEAIGEDFGFNPLWLRVPFATAVLFSPAFAMGAYLALGLAVLLSRLLFPNSGGVVAAEEIMPGTTGAPANDKAGREKLPIAA